MCKIQKLNSRSFVSDPLGKCISIRAEQGGSCSWGRCGTLPALLSPLHLCPVPPVPLCWGCSCLWEGWMSLSLCPCCQGRGQEEPLGSWACRGQPQQQQAWLNPRSLSPGVCDPPTAAKGPLRFAKFMSPVHPLCSRENFSLALG